MQNQTQQSSASAPWPRQPYKNPSRAPRFSLRAHKGARPAAPAAPARQQAATGGAQAGFGCPENEPCRGETLLQNLRSCILLQAP